VFKVGFFVHNRQNKTPHQILEHCGCPESDFCSNWVFHRTCSACEEKLMNVCLMEAQIFQMVGPARSSPSGFGASSSGSDLPPPPPKMIVEAFMMAQTGVLCQIL
jgi:hypothetical protein